MRGRQILLYFAWSRPAETSAPLAVIEDRFPAIFELRRLFYPEFERLSDRDTADQGIAGFLDLIQKPNFQAFAEQTEALTGRKVIQIERDPAAPPHPFTQAGRSSFDALLQSRPDTFAGKLLVCDTTMFSSTAGGVENLRRFWANVVLRPEAFPASIA